MLADQFSEAFNDFVEEGWITESGERQLPPEEFAQNEAESININLSLCLLVRVGLLVCIPAFLVDDFGKIVGGVPPQVEDRAP
jgi:hypothetical protein